jgi:hypothetical protein
MGLPNGQGSLSLELPIHDAAVGIASEQATVLPHKAHAVYLGSVSAQNVAGLGRWKRRGVALQGHVS